MAEPALKDVIERLKVEGQLVRNTGTNSIKSTKEILSGISVSLVQHTNILQEILKFNKLLYGEYETERDLKSANISTIEPSVTPPTGSPPSARPTPPVPQGFDFGDVLNNLGKLGLVLGGLATGLGITAGIVIGQLKAIESFFPKTSAAIIKLFSDFETSISTIFTNFKTSVAALFKSTVKVLDDSLAFIKNLFNINSSSRIAKVFSAIKGSIDSIVKTFAVAGKTLVDIVKTVSGITSPLGSLGSMLSTFGKAVGMIAKTVGRLFAPVAVIIALFDTITGIIEGYAEGGSILGALSGGIKGLFNSLIFGPLDLLKNVISWISSKLGFENFSSMLDSFSFSDLFSGLVDAIFNGVSQAFSVITDLFTFEESDLTALGAVGKLTDFLFAGINMSINFIKGIFGFEETEEPFKLQDWIEQKALEIFNWIGDLFSFLPSISDMKEKLISYLPAWMQPDSVNQQRQVIQSKITEQQDMISSGDERNWRGKKREDIVKELEQELVNLPQYNKGSQGFVDFGMGTPAILHGIEAVVPKDSPAGAFLSRNFDENFKPIARRLETVQSSAISNTVSSPIIIANAPTIAPVNNNVRGNTNYSSQRITSLTGGSNGSGLGRFAN